MEVPPQNINAINVNWIVHYKPSSYWSAPFEETPHLPAFTNEFSSEFPNRISQVTSLAQGCGHLNEPKQVKFKQPSILNQEL